MTKHAHRGTTNASSRSISRLAFTLIELLVVIAVIGVLIGVLLPALSSSRKAARSLRELGTLRQVGTAFVAYAQDNKGKLMPGYLRGSWAKPTRRKFIVYDNPRDASEENRLTGEAIRSYPWRLLPYLDYEIGSLVVDKALLADIRAKPSDQNDRRGFQRTLARHPSFGMNTTYVGGDAHRGAFYLPSVLRWKQFYVTREDQVTQTSRLVIFASSRAVMPGTNGDIVPGYQRIEGPWHATPTSDSVPAFIKWTAPTKFNPSLPTPTYGHLDFRHAGKAAVLTLDGHAEKLSLEQLNNMTRWCNLANNAQWRPY